MSDDRQMQNMSPNSVSREAYYIQDDEEEIDLYAYFQLLWAKKWYIILFSLLCAALTFGICKVMTKQYVVEATLMPPSSSSGQLSSLLSQFGGMPGLGDLASGFAKNGDKSGHIINMLESKTLAEKVIEDLTLMDVFFPPEKYKDVSEEKKPILEDAIGLFHKKIFTVKNDKKNHLIKVSVKWKDANLGVKIIDKVLVALQDFINNNEFTEAKRNKIFIKEQLQDSRAALLEAEKELNRFYSLANVSSVRSQVNVDLGVAQSVPKTIEDIRESIENEDKKSVHSYTSRYVPNVPAQVYYNFLQQEKIILTKVNALLAQQFELAKIEEIKESLSFQIIDKPMATKRNYTPKPKLYSAIALFVGCVFAIMYFFFVEALKKVKTRHEERGV